MPACLAVFLATWMPEPRPPVVLPVYPAPYTAADMRAGKPVPF